MIQDVLRYKTLALKCTVKTAALEKVLVLNIISAVAVYVIIFTCCKPLIQMTL